jgi:hypothetical protein
VLSCPLRKNQDAGNHKDDQRGRSGIAAQIEATMREGLIKKIAYDGAERARQDKRRPKERGFRNLCPEMASCHESQK